MTVVNGWRITCARAPAGHRTLRDWGPANASGWQRAGSGREARGGGREARPEGREVGEEGGGGKVCPCTVSLCPPTSLLPVS
eukprot:gene17312-biopygen7652